MTTPIHDATQEFHENADGLFMRTQQAIPSEHMDRLRAERDASMDPMTRELNRVASVPVAVVERWLSEGFNIYQASAKDILARLRNQSLDGFITTRRRI